LLVSRLLAVAAVVGGLHGVVMRGPTMPVCRVGTPCTAPAVGAVLVFSTGGHTVAQVRSGGRGRYSIQLPPGLYMVRLGSIPRIGFGLKPNAVRVVVGATRRVDFMIDTGIR
jgi:hypothetical protein